MQLINEIIERVAKIKTLYSTVDSTTSGAWEETHAVYPPLEMAESVLRGIAPTLKENRRGFPISTCRWMTPTG